MSNKIKCPLSAYGGCNELAEVVQFGEHTRSAKRGHKKYYIRCPEHGSIRLDKDTAQAVIIKLVNGTEPEKPETPKPEKPEPTPEEKPEKPDKIAEEWGF